MLKIGSSQKYNFIINYDSEDIYVGGDIARDTYEPFESDIFLSRLKRNLVLFDVGTNIGYYSLLASEVISTNFIDRERISSFEPNLKNYLLLLKNVSDNKKEKLITPINKAVGNKKGEVSLYLSSENQGDHQVFQSNRNISERVKITTFR